MSPPPQSTRGQPSVPTNTNDGTPISSSGGLPTVFKMKPKTFTADNRVKLSCNIITAAKITRDTWPTWSDAVQLQRRSLVNTQLQQLGKIIDLEDEWTTLKLQQQVKFGTGEKAPTLSLRMILGKVLGLRATLQVYYTLSGSDERKAVTLTEMQC